MGKELSDKNKIIVSMDDSVDKDNEIFMLERFVFIIVYVYDFDIIKLMKIYFLMWLFLKKIIIKLCNIVIYYWKYLV